jgi:hypothetical protein
MTTEHDYPIARYRHIITIDSNTIEEFAEQVYRLGTDLDHEPRILTSYASSNRVSAYCEERNPSMTPERYASELETWFAAVQAERATNRAIPGEPTP